MATHDMRMLHSNKRRLALQTVRAVLWVLFVALAVLVPPGSRPTAAEGLQMPATQATPIPPMPMLGPTPVPPPTPVPCLPPPPTHYNDGKVHHKVLFVSGSAVTQLVQAPLSPVSQSGWDDIKAFLQLNPITRDLNLSEKDFLYFSYSGYHCDVQGRKDYTRPIYYPIDTTLFLLADYDSRANTIEEILNAFPEDEFVLIGHSLGGVVSLYWASSRLISPIPQPIDRVKSIITLDSPLTGRPGPCGIDLPVIPQSVVDVLPKALDRVSVLTIANIYDTYVKPEEATLPGVWRKVEGNFGGANFVNPCDPEAHGTVLQNTVVASEIAAAVWPAHIIGPSTRNPFSAGSNTQPAEINITVTWPRSNELANQLSSKQTGNLHVTVGGRPAQVLNIKDLVPILRAFRLWVLPPSQPAGGKYDLTVSMGNESDTQVQSVEMTGPPPGPGPSPVTGTATVLIFDVSGSMDWDDPSGKRKIKAAQDAALLVTRMIRRENEQQGTDHQVGVVAFTNDAWTLQPLTSEIGDVERAIARLEPQGGTNLAAGLIEGARQFQNSTDQDRRILILLSDGVPTVYLDGRSASDRSELTALEQEVLDEAVPQAVSASDCLYVIGFGDPDEIVDGWPSIDEDFLRQIVAATTCGGYYIAETADELANLYVQLRHESTGTLVGTWSGTVAQGDTTPPILLDVPPNQSELHVTLNWPGSRLDLLLTDPQGQSVDNTYPGATLFTDEPPVYAIVRNPAAGTWQAQVYGADVPQGTTDYNLIASTRSAPVKPTPPAAGGSVWTPLRPGRRGPIIVLLTLLTAIGAALVQLGLNPSAV